MGTDGSGTKPEAWREDPGLWRAECLSGKVATSCEKEQGIYLARHLRATDAAIWQWLFQEASSS